MSPSPPGPPKTNQVIRVTAKTIYDTLETECGTDLRTYEKACQSTTWTFEGPVTVQCVTGDPGTDTGDAGDGT